MRVKEVMTTSPLTVSEDTSLKAAARKMLESGVSGLPVVDEGGGLVGIITEADFVARQAGHVGRRRLLNSLWRHPDPPSDTESVGEAMTGAPVTIVPDATITEAARAMTQHRVKRLPVVDIQGRLVGIISRGDVMRAFARSDSAVEEEIRNGILTRLLFHEPSAVDVRVDEGVVRLSGELPRKSDVGLLVALADRVDGVVRVEDNLTWRYDDATIPGEGSPLNV